ncbi:hypothetical protein [Pseudoalteromonas luteoviolacea]|nr:hypothetical protein [Pseudoalteromonas luteoviolacea]
MKYAFLILLFRSLIGGDISEEISSLDTVNGVENDWVFAQL